MTVYIEYVLIDNLVIDYLTLKLTCYILRKEYSKLRLFFTALLGAVFALAYPLYAFGGILEVLIKLLMGVLLSLISNKYKSFKEGLTGVLTFTFVTFLFGGAVYAIFNFFKIKVGTEFSIAVCILPVIVLYKILKALITALIKNKEVKSVTYDITINKNGKKVTGKGFLDTGNLTFIEGKPALFISLDFLEKTLEVKDYQDFKKTRITTATGSKENYRVLLDEFGVYCFGKWNIYNNVWAVIVKSEILCNCDVLFGTAFLEGVNAKIIA